MEYISMLRSEQKMRTHLLISIEKFGALLNS
jgi:hypothetical protein